METFKMKNFSKKDMKNSKSIKKMKNSITKSPSLVFSTAKLYDEFNTNRNLLNEKKLFKYGSTPHTPNKDENKKSITNINYVDKSKTFNINNQTLQKISSVPSLLNSSKLEQDIFTFFPLNLKKYGLKNKILNMQETKKNLTKDNNFSSSSNLNSNRNKRDKVVEVTASKSPILTFEEHLQKLLAEKEEYINKIKNKKKILKARYKNLEVEYKKLLEKYKEYSKDPRDPFLKKICSYETDIYEDSSNKGTLVKYPTMSNAQDEKKFHLLTNNYNTSTSISNKYKSFSSFSERKADDGHKVLVRNNSGSFNNNTVSKRSSSALETNNHILGSFSNSKTLDIKEKICGGLEMSDLNQPIQLDGSINKNHKSGLVCTNVFQNIKKRTQILLDSYLSLLQNSNNRKNLY